MVGVSDAQQVTDNQSESRFELRVDGLLAELPYRRNGKRLVLIHTEVPEQLEGRGLGGALVTAAIDRAAREGLTVVPLCPFARGGDYQLALGQDLSIGYLSHDATGVELYFQETMTFLVYTDEASVAIGAAARARR